MVNCGGGWRLCLKLVARSISKSTVHMPARSRAVGPTRVRYGRVARQWRPAATDPSGAGAGLVRSATVCGQRLHMFKRADKPVNEITILDVELARNLSISRTTNRPARTAGCASLSC